MEGKSLEEKVSIVIPVFNAEKELERCVNAILNQNYSNIELIIVDDGSVDSTLSIAEKYASDRVLIFKNDKKGVSSARNYGMKHITGDYVTFVDADDLIAADFVKTLVDSIKNYDCDCSAVAYTNEINDEKNEAVEYVSRKYDDEQKYRLLIESKWKCGGYVWNKMYKVSIIKKNNICFNEDIALAEDLLFNYSYFKVSKSFCFYTKPMYYYTLNSASAVNDICNPKWFDILAVYKKMIESDLPKSIKTQLQFNFSQVILEAKYRLNYYEGDNFTEGSLKKLQEEYVRFNVDYSFKQNLKLLLFMIFPDQVMKYKRRSIKE